MERWLSKSRVLIALSVVLLMSALNRQDPLLYRMFLFMAVLSALGYLLPWLSLRSLRVRLEGRQQIEVAEGTPLELGMWIEKTSSWPSFMVEVQAEWVGAGRTIVSRQTVGVIRKGQLPDVASHMSLPCRGEYVLSAVRLSSGFPLGLTTATHTMPRPDVRVLVLPRVLPTHWPLPWDITEDPRGELSTRRPGQSFEPGVLRPYEQGQPVGRVNWNASARTGQLIIQHFQQSGSLRLRVVVDHPSNAECGDPNSAGEQAIRLAMGVVLAAADQGVQTWTYVPGSAHPVEGSTGLSQSLARVTGGASALPWQLRRAAGDGRVGEQLAVVVGATAPPQVLLSALAGADLGPVHAVVYLAVGRPWDAGEKAQALHLQAALKAAGWRTLLEPA